jgi:hypothetical protein
MAEFDISYVLDESQVRALKRAISSADAAARRELRAVTKEAGTIVQKEIQSRTPIYAGGRDKYHRPRQLLKATKLKVGRLSVAVYNDAKSAPTRRYPGGYRYGKRIEFDPSFGDFAFFYPGWAAAKDRAREAFDKVLKTAYDTFIRGG